MSSSITSIRLDRPLAERLEQAARRLARGKNWVVTQALREYLLKIGQEGLAAEARRQSLIIARAERRGADKGLPEEDIEEWR